MKILWLIEHSARELDVACAVKSLMEKEFGAEVIIKHLFNDLAEVIALKSQPDLIALPYFYSAEDFGMKEIIKRFPDSVIFNMAWEEIFYKGHINIKAPKGEFAFNRVMHHAWGSFFRDYLQDAGVKSSQIIVNGNPSLQLNRPPYNSIYESRKAIAEKFDLNISDKWILVPDNYVWAFADSGLLKLKSRHGGSVEQMLSIKEYCRNCLREVLRWFSALAEEDGITVIYRPKPAVSLDEFREFAETEVKGGTRRIRFIKDLDVKQWISVSDMVFSSFSTTLMDAAVAGKPVYMLEPLPVPEFFVSEWQETLDRVRSLSELTESVNGDNNRNGDLKAWVENSMLSKGDPVKNLCHIISSITGNSMDAKDKDASVNGLWKYNFLLREKIKQFTKRRSKYSGELLSADEINRRKEVFCSLFASEEL